jgi:hypothetical protein
MPFDKFNAHLIGKERVFEIGRVVDPRCQHGDGWLCIRHVRCAGGQRPTQVNRVLLHGLNPVLREKLGEHLQHGFPVFEHVAHTRRGAGVVFENVELPRSGADKVDANDMGIDPARHVDADHLGLECFVLGDHLTRDAPGLQDFLGMVDVMQKGVDRPHPLFDPARQFGPFGA